MAESKEGMVQGGEKESQLLEAISSPVNEPSFLRGLPFRGKREAGAVGRESGLHHPKPSLFFDGENPLHRGLLHRMGVTEKKFLPRADPFPKNDLSFFLVLDFKGVYGYETPV